MNSVGGHTLETCGTLFIGHKYALQPNNGEKMRLKVQKLGVKYEKS